MAYGLRYFGIGNIQHSIWKEAVWNRECTTLHKEWGGVGWNRGIGNVQLCIRNGVEKGTYNLA